MIRLLLQLSIAASVALYICSALVNTDLWLNVAVGRWILSHGSVPRVDIWNSLSLSGPWSPYPWLFQVVVASVWDTLGPEGLILFKAFLSFLLVSSLVYAYSELSTDSFIGTLLAVVAASALYAHFELAPAVIAWTLFALTISVANSFDGKSSLNPRSLLVVFLVFVLWSNVHPTSLFGLFCLVTFARGNRVIIAAVSLFGAFLGPIVFGGFDLLLPRFLELFTHASLFSFQPASFDIYPVSFLLLLLAVLFTLLHFYERVLSVGQLVGLTFITVVGMSSMPHLPFSLVYCASLIAVASKVAMGRVDVLGNLGVAASGFRRGLQKAPLAVVISLCVLFAGGSLYNLKRSPFGQQGVPDKAVSFLLSNNLPGPVLNTVSDGAYLMFRFSGTDGVPSRQVSIDSRSELSDRAVVALHDGAAQGMSTWRDYVRRVDPGVILWPSSSAMTTILKAGRTWCVVFQSDGWTVFVKREWASSSETLSCITD